MNWKIRLKNYTFWVGLIGLIGMIVVYAVPGFDFGPVREIMLAVLALAVTLGVVSDPTTPGASDSDVSLAKNNITDTAKDVVKKLQAESESEAAADAATRKVRK